MSLRLLSGKTILHNIINLRQLVFEVTDDCNLRCYYCGFGDLYCDYDTRESRYLTLKDVLPLFDYLVNLWANNYSEAACPQVTIGFYGGEPLLNMPFIRDTVDYVKRLNINRSFSFSLTTNAVLLDKHMQFLVDNDVKLLISIDGDKNSNGYRVFKSGKESFDLVLRNVHMLQDRFPKYFDKCVGFNSVVHNLNNENDIISFIRKEFGKETMLSELNTSGVNPSKRDSFDKIFKTMHAPKQEGGSELSYNMIQNNPKAFASMRYLQTQSNYLFDNYLDLLYDNNTGRKRFHTGTCLPFSRKMFVTVNGKILPCERVSHRHAMGTVSNGELNLDCEQIASSFNAYHEKLEKMCAGCGLIEYCPQCMYQIDSIDSSRIECSMRKSKNDAALYKDQCIHYLVEHPGLYKTILSDAGM